MENKTNTLSTDEMWTTLRKAPDFVLDGYDVPRLYIDAVKQKKQRELTERVEDQIRSPKKYWPVKKDDQIVVFKRPNYLDDVKKIDTQIFKLANSYYDKEKAEKVMEKLSNKEKSDDNKGNTIPKLYKHDRYSYFDDLIKVEKKKFDYYNFREEIIKDASEKKKAYEDKKDKIESDKLKGIINTEGGHDYKKFGSLPKSDRITILEDIVHSAELIPFCKQIETIPKMIEITDDKGKKKQVENFERLDYPKVYLIKQKKVILSQSPKWSFGKVVSKTEEQIAAIDKRQEDLKTKIEKIRETVINRNKTRPNILNEDLRNSFIAVDNYKKIIGPSLVKVDLIYLVHTPTSTIFQCKGSKTSISTRSSTLLERKNF